MNFIKVGRLLLFFLSNFGYWEYFRKKSGMNVFFLPAFIVSLQVTLLFLAGILNCLRIAVFLIFGIGLALAVYYLVKDSKCIVKNYLNVGYLFLVVMVSIMLVATRGHLFTHYDNFSHWALVVRGMLITDRFPSFKDTLIEFQAYPLGSASYIYYVAKIISMSEGIQMFAQAYMMLCFILPVFKYVSKRKLESYTYVILFTNFIFVYNIRITELLVDTLLPLQGMAMLFFLCSECLGFGVRNKKECVSVLYAIPFLCMSAQTKNSGMFFVAIVCVLLLMSLKYERQGAKQKIVTIAAPFLSLFLWKSHCDYVFPAASSSKHAMSVENYKAVFSGKSPEDVKNIFFGVINYAITSKELYFLLAFMAVLGLISLLSYTGARKRYLKVVSGAVVLYILYMLGIFLMYLFSMPGGEATRLAGIGRYQKTIFIAIYYLMLLTSLVFLSKIDGRKKEWLGLFAALAMIVMNWRGVMGNFSNVFTPDEYTSERFWFQQAIRENKVQDGKKYIVCIPRKDQGYAFYLCKYLLYSNDISVRIIEENGQMDDFLEYDYIFVYDKENEYIYEWVNEKYSEQLGNSVITIK